MIYVNRLSKTAKRDSSEQGGSGRTKKHRPESGAKAKAKADARAADLELTVVGGSMDNSQTSIANEHSQVEQPQAERRKGDSRKNDTVDSINNGIDIVKDSADSNLLRRTRAELFLAVSLMVLFITIFVLGRMYWDERYYIPEEGLGYYLGLVGGSMMLVAYAYTAFKYVAFLRSRAVMRHWLTIHIFFGVAGPMLILLHSTFRFGSLNGGIALIAMILVFASGVMARFIYAKTHYGLGGQKERVKDLKEKLALSGHKIKSQRLDRFTNKILGHKETLLYAIWDLLTFGWRSRWLYFRLSEAMRIYLNTLSTTEGWDARLVRRKKKEFKRQLREYILTLRKVVLFGVYERFFAFWRNAHVPLLYLLLMSGIMHVVAVHMY